MIDPRTLELAKSQGYRPHGNWQHMFCDYAFWKALAKAVAYEGTPLELADEFLPLIFAANDPDDEDLETFHDDEHHLQSAWDDLVERPSVKEEPVVISKPEGFWWCRSGANVSKEKGGRVHARLKELFGADIYASWFASLEFYSLNDGVLTATVPVKFLKNWIDEHYSDDLLQVCSEMFGGLERVDVVMRYPSMPSRR